MGNEFQTLGAEDRKARDPHYFIRSFRSDNTGPYNVNVSVSVTDLSTR